MKAAIYDKSTGAIRMIVDARIEEIGRQCADGEAVYEGEADQVKDRIDPATKTRVPYVPDSPGDGAVWDEASYSWIPAARADLRRRQSIIAQIEVLEAKVLRPLLEVRVNPDNAEDARRLADIRNQIISLRSQL